MKILQINCVYGQGSTGELVRTLHESLLKQGVASQVIYGRGEPGEQRKLCSEWYARGQHLLSALRGIPYGGCLLSTEKLIGWIRREQPDVVHLHCLNGYFVNQYRLLTWLGKHDIPTVLTLHAEFPYTGNCAHALDCEKWKSGCGGCPRWRYAPHSLFFDRTARAHEKMARAFGTFGENLTVVSVSRWLAHRAVQAPMLMPFRQEVIYNGVDTQVFFFRGGLSQKKTVFHATAQFSEDPEHLKGGYYLLELAKRMPQVQFLVAGPYRLRKKSPGNVRFLGEIRDKETLSRLYSGANVTLLTSRAESYSLVCAESLCCGTPVAGFRAGAPEEIALENASRFVPFGDVAALEAAVDFFLESPPDPEDLSRKARQRYNREKMTAAYSRLYFGG